MKGKKHRKAQWPYAPKNSFDRLGWSLAAVVTVLLGLLVGRYGW